MALVKAIIQPLDEKMLPFGIPVPVMFNPSEYSLEAGNQFQSTVMPGLSSPITQFISGNSKTLTMELFFDTYEQGVDVRLTTCLLTGLLDVNSEMHAPPICLFVYGTFMFKGVIERITQRFTMFLETGIPVRATLNVTFKEYSTLTSQFQLIPRFSPDRSKLRTVKQGDALWMFSAKEYGDAGAWRHIASANKIYNPRKLRAGMEIMVPPLR